MIEAIASFFGMIIRFIYELVNNNYFVSIIIFTILTKLILFPLSLGQIKSTEEIKKIAPKEKQIKEKYKNDKNKQAEELTKLYAEHKINPLGGCLPLLLQLPIILGMFYIVRQPLTYITQTPTEQIQQYTQEVLGKETVTETDMNNNQLVVAKEKGLIDMQVFPGFNLGDVPANVFSKDPNKKASPLALLIPILTIVFSVVQNKIMMKSSSMSDEQKEMQKSMNLMMPIFSAFIAYTMPLALGVYWLLGNIWQIGQQMVITKIIQKDEEKLALGKGGE